MDPARRKEYWRRNLRLMVILLTIWFLVSYVGGILAVDVLNNISLGSFPLGFWIAQQGSIYTFVLLIAFYAWRMDKIDDEMGVAERDEDGNRL